MTACPDAIVAEIVTAIRAAIADELPAPLLARPLHGISGQVPDRPHLVDTRLVDTPVCSSRSVDGNGGVSQPMTTVIGIDRPASATRFGATPAVAQRPNSSQLMAAFDYSARRLRSWDWQLEAACAGLDTELFFHADHERGAAVHARESKAKAICARCPVVDTCLMNALARHEQHGIWGGKTAVERIQLAAS